MPFDPDAYLSSKVRSGGFDPDAYLSKKQEPGLGEAIARGGAQGLTYGLADEASGALGAAGDLLTGQAGLSDLGSSYRDYRDAYRRGDKAAATAHPTASGLSELAGGIAAPGGVGAKGLGVGARVARAGLQGAATGFGKSEADYPSGLLSDAATGGALGVGGLGVGGLLSKAIPTAAGTGNLAVRKAVQHLRPTPKVAQSLGPEKLGEIGKEALDSGAIKFGANAGATAERLDSLREDAGKKIGSILSSSEAKVDPAAVAARVKKDVIAPLSEVSGNNSVVSQLEKQVSDFLEKHAGADTAGPAYGNKEISAGLLEKEKRAVQDGINYFADASTKKNAQSKYANVLQSANEEAISNANPTQGAEFLAAKKKFGNLAGAEAMAKRTGALTDSGNGLMGGLLDMNAGNMAVNALVHGEPLTGGLIGGARALTRGRTHSSVATTANIIANQLAKHPRSNATMQMLEQLIQQGAPAAARQSGDYTEAK